MFYILLGERSQGFRHHKIQIDECYMHCKIRGLKLLLNLHFLKVIKSVIFLALANVCGNVEGIKEGKEDVRGWRGCVC